MDSFITAPVLVWNVISSLHFHSIASETKTFDFDFLNSKSVYCRSIENR